MRLVKEEHDVNRVVVTLLELHSGSGGQLVSENTVFSKSASKTEQLITLRTNRNARAGDVFFSPRTPLDSIPDTEIHSQTKLMLVVGAEC